MSSGIAVYKETAETEFTLGSLRTGDLFEKDCNNPCATYMKANCSKIITREFGSLGMPHCIVVDLTRAEVKVMPSKTLVVPLENDGLTVREKE